MPAAVLMPQCVAPCNTACSCRRQTSGKWTHCSHMRSEPLTSSYASFGKQPKRWEIIVSQHLPYRTVSHGVQAVGCSPGQPAAERPR